MRQIMISIVGGCIIFYVVPAMSMELLMLEQQLSTLAHEEVPSKSVSDLLQDRYKTFIEEYKKNPHSLFDQSQDLKKHVDLYQASIKVPTHDGHVNWNEWLNIYPHQLNENQVHALYTLCRCLNDLDLEIIYKLFREEFNIKKLNNIIEFRSLVEVLEEALPEQNFRKAKGQELLRMLNAAEQINQTIGEQERRIEREKLLRQYTDAAFLAIFFRNISDPLLRVICRSLSLVENDCNQLSKGWGYVFEALGISSLYADYSKDRDSYPGIKENPKKVTFISEPQKIPSEMVNIKPVEQQKLPEKEQKEQAQAVRPVLRSVKDILKAEISKQMRDDIGKSKITDFSSKLAESKKLYEKSIGMPIDPTSQHLDWMIWIDNTSLKVVDKLKALGSFWRYVDYMYYQMLHIMQDKDIRIEKLEAIQEFNDLVGLLEAALPASSVREAIGKEIVEIWKFFADLLPSSTTIGAFIEQYYIEFLWMEYFELLHGNKIRTIITQALLINPEDALKYYEKARDNLQKIPGYMELYDSYLKSALFRAYAV
jgi:hypothetical protein